MAQDGAAAVAEYATLASSLLLRLLTYVFLRWASTYISLQNYTSLTIQQIPGHPFPPLIFSLFALYGPSFAYTLARVQPYEVLEDEVRVVTKERPASEQDLQDVDPRYTNGDAPKDPGEELDVEETIVVEEKGPQILWTILTGLPSPSSLLWSLLTFAINIALVAMTWDLVYRAPLFYPSHDLSMARVGYVSDSAAKIFVRERDTDRHPIYISYRHADPPLAVGGHYAHDTAWKAAGSIASVDDSTDYTGVFELKDLQSDTHYQYTAANHTGFFTTAPKSGHLSSRAPTEGSFTFLHSSCLKNNLPYNPFAHPLSNKGLRHLASNISSLKATFMLFLGDFIYIDVPRRLGSSTAEDYRREYRQLYSSPDWEGASQDLPWIHVYDDHEIANDWDKNTTGFFPAANDPYTHYHTAANPPAHRQGETYFSFTSGPAAFFLLDTRRYRSPNDGADGWDTSTKTLLGATQLSDLLSWLASPEPEGVRWKIVVSSVPFTKNWWLNAQDTWRGYLGERQMILEAMWDAAASGSGTGVIILSGDRHEFAATAFPPPPEGKEEITGLGHVGAGAAGFLPNSEEQTTLRTRRKKWPASATVHEFSASPLNMFYLPLRTYAESSTSEEYVSDVCVKYIPDGNSKFGAISISQPVTSEQNLLRYRLFVDGAERWSYVLSSPPAGRRGEIGLDAIWG